MTLADDVPDGDEPEGPPPPPSLPGALREAVTDFFFNSWRIVPVNVVWGVWFIVVLFVWASLNLVVAVVLSPPLAIPLAGLARFGGLATRRRGIDLSDALDPIRRRPRAVLVGGVGFAAGLLVLGVNVFSGLAMASGVGVALATIAGWGLVALLAYGVTFWPLITDPARDDVPSPAIARLAALLLLTQPFRIGALALVVAAILAVSTVVFAALITIAVGFVLLVAARYVLPAADRLQAAMEAREAVA